MVCKYPSRVPRYNDDSDYTTNAPSYYDDLARKNKLIKVLAEKIGFYDEELAKRFEEWDELIKKFPQNVEDLLIQWMEDGTLDDIINKNIFKDLNELIDSNYDELNGLIKLNADELKGFINDLSEEMNKRLDNSAVNYTVGSTGNFNTLNNAIDHIRQLSIKPKKATITILKDYILRDQVIFINEDFRFLEITSSSELLVSINGSEVGTYNNSLPVIYGENATLPTLDVLFNFMNTKTGDNRNITGLYVNNSTVKIKEGKGFTNFPYIGVMGVNNSVIVANGGIFNNNGIIPDDHGAGIKVSRSSLTAESSFADDCGECGYWIQEASIAKISKSTARRAGHHNLVISQGSTATARNSDFTNCPDNAVVVTTNSSLDLSGSDCSGCGNNNIVAQLNSSVYFENGISNDSGISGLNITKHSYASAQGATLNNNASHGLDSKDGSDVNFLGGTANGNGRNGIYCLDGSKVACRGATINNNKEQGIHCYGGYVDAYRTEIKGNTVSGIRSFNGGRVTADESDIQNNGDYGLHASRGEIWASKSICKNNANWDVGASFGGKIVCAEIEVSATGETIRCTTSSVIHAPRVIGSNKANTPSNTLNGHGVIFSDDIQQS